MSRPRDDGAPALIAGPALAHRHRHELQWGVILLDFQFWSVVLLQRFSRLPAFCLLDSKPGLPEKLQGGLKKLRQMVTYLRLGEVHASRVILTFRHLFPVIFCVFKVKCYFLIVTRRCASYAKSFIFFSVRNELFQVDIDRQWNYLWYCLW